MKKLFKTKKAIPYALILIIILGIVFMLSFSKSEDSVGNNAHMEMGSGIVTQVDIKNSKIIVQLDEQYRDDLGNYKSIILKCRPRSMDYEKLSNIKIGKMIQYYYFPDQVNENIIEEVSEIY